MNVSELQFSVNISLNVLQARVSQMRHSYKMSDFLFIFHTFTDNRKTLAKVCSLHLVAPS